ncbi:MAG: hypothetical protein HYV07_24865 [Deltaproteobacteria bacterium]|nr:hypothetical protein [Deltaproteobacteria bacterium]
MKGRRASHVMVGSTMWLAGLALLTLAPRPDPAARGLDLFVVAPPATRADVPIPIAVIAYGFPTMKTWTPLDRASIEVSVSIPNQDAVVSRATTGPDGRVFLEAKVPSGDAESYSVLVAVRHGDRSRARELSVTRERSATLELFVDQSRVVPGSEVNAFARATSPLGALRRSLVAFEVRDGARVIARLDALTNESGIANARVRIPATLHRSITIEASLRSRNIAIARATRSLDQRDDTPGSATLNARFEGFSVRPGRDAIVELETKDATGAPIANLPIRAWVGERSAEPKDDAAFKTRSKLAITDDEGLVRSTFPAPTAVPARGSTLVVRAEAEVDGRPLSARAELDVRRPASNVEILPEAGRLVPHTDEDLLVRLTDDLGRPIARRARIEADGIRVDVVTDRYGEAVVRHRVPRAIGSRHPSGACAGEVAATFTVTLLDDPIETLRTCVNVDRDAAGFLRVTPPIANAGDEVELELVGDDRAWTITVSTEPATIVFGQGHVRARIPEGSSGPSPIRARLPGNADRLLSAVVLVRPPRITTIETKLVGGRLAPEGYADIEARMRGPRGEPVQGWFSASVVDARSGADLSGLRAMDTRHMLTRGVDSGHHPIDELIGDGRDLDVARRVGMSAMSSHRELTVLDPIEGLDVRLAETFRSVVRQLEGALYEAATEGRLEDARSVEGGRSSFNAELLTTATEALEEPPTTPGGEPIVLSDLVEIDPAVRYDVVAHRVTRLKLFRVWSQLREHVMESRATFDEPMLKNPAAMLRRLVRDGPIDPAALLDGWGGTIGFVPGQGRGLPFFGIFGHHLASPGPDGKLGTSDDVSDPFERALKSGSPYAIAVDEDALVDARDDLVVGDAVVESWRNALERGTGDVFGEAFGGFGVSGIGSGGGGSGSGGLGSRAATISTRGASSRSSFLPPVRADEAGRAVLRVPLGPEETTWLVGVVGMPDDGAVVVETLEVKSSLPLSVRIDPGVGWHEGDEVEVVTHVRNRTDLGLEVDLQLGAQGSIAAPADPRVRVTVPKRSEIAVTRRVTALRAGDARLEAVVRARGPDQDFDDSLATSWVVSPKGTSFTRAAATSVSAPASLELPSLGVPMGPARLSLARGTASVEARALRSLDQGPSDPSPIETLELAGRILETCGADEASERCSLANERKRAALDKLSGSALPWPDRLRAAPYSDGRTQSPSPCPSKPERPARLDQLIDVLLAEPPPLEGAVRTCWDEMTADAVQKASASPDPVLESAKLVLALARSPHRRASALALAERLSARIRPDGKLSLEDPSPSTEAIVRTALAALGLPGGDLERVTALEASTGGFGNRTATRFVLLGLRSVDSSSPGACEIEVSSPNRPPLNVVLGREGATNVTFDRAARQVTVRPLASSCRLSARLTQNAIRPWSSPPSPSASGLAIQARWPASAKRGARANLQLTLRARGEGGQNLEARAPLPPGGHLYESVGGRKIMESMGELIIEARVGDVPEVIDIPLRFTHGGSLTIPEASLRSLERELEPAYAPAAKIEVTK